MRSSALLLFCLSGFLCLSGCTSPNPDANGPPGVTMDLSLPTDNPDGASGQDLALSDEAQLDQACTALATALCDKLGRCSAYYQQYYYGDAKNCVERIKLTCAPYTKLRGSSWTLPRLRACADGYASATCDEYFSPGGPAACRPQPGTLADNAVCANSNQCASGFCSLGVTGCGACLKPGKLGATCGTAQPCDLGLSCVSGKCGKEGGPGDSCGTGQPACRTGMYCKAGTCAAQLAGGATCDPASTVTECDPAQGLFCDTSRKCVAYKLAKAGEACGTVAGSTVLCAGGGTCSGTGTNRKCVAAALDGQACGPAGGNASCQSPASCTANACKVFDPSVCK